MGQPVAVTVKPTLDPHVRVFDTNRWLTGMGSGTFATAGAAPEGTIARFVLEWEGIDRVHVYGHAVTVTKRTDAKWEEIEKPLQTALENFYLFYPVEDATAEPDQETAE